MRTRRGKHEEGEEPVEPDPKKIISPSKRRQARDFSHLPKRVQAERNAKRPPPKTSWDHQVFRIKGLDRFRLARIFGAGSEDSRDDPFGSSTQSSFDVNGTHPVTDHNDGDQGYDQELYEPDKDLDGPALSANSSQSTHPAVKNESATRNHSQQSKLSETSVDCNNGVRAEALPTPDADAVGTREIGNTKRGSDVPEHETAKDEEDIEIIEEELPSEAFPPPYLSDREAADFEEEPDLDAEVVALLKSRFKRLPNPHAFVQELTRFPAKNRSSDVLYRLAENAQEALVAWQDEFLKLDAFIARNTNPPRKRATGGRQQLGAEVADAMKEADIYGYRYDARRGPGMQVPELQRFFDDEDHAEGRLLRRRKPHNEYAMSDDDAANTETGKRKRKAVHRYDATPEDGSRKRMRQTPDPVHVRRRGRPPLKAPPNALLPPRIQAMRAMREQSTASTSVTTSDDEDRGSTPEKPTKRRGRPPGSKNLYPRSDAGIKKGPRKKLVSLEETVPGNVMAREPPEKIPGIKTDAKPSDDAVQKAAKIKSESRSESMTLWWKKRKAEQAAAQDERTRLDAERKPPHSRSNSTTL
ncbi:hypothetical protein P152DRAFT_478618, partial [Eremomyces bilateralis CBS 781.70]